MEKQIRKILEVIESNGYKAYLVGGYVRDYLLGRKTYDVDICTNALPVDIKKMFNASKCSYGSVNFMLGKYNVDITTFREEYNYQNRKPEKFVYIDNLEKDLLRRDFTVNALCMDKNGHVIDLLGGIDDLNDNKIKMIGNTQVKGKEDPLRILRAIRFSTVLNFDLDDELLNFIKNNYKLVSSLSKNRIKMEMDKILLSKNYQKGLNYLKITKVSDTLGIEFENVVYVDDLHGMWAQIKADMPFTNEEKSNIIKIASGVKKGVIDNFSLYKNGLYINQIVGKILGVNPREVSRKYNHLPIKTRKDINITCKDIEKIVESPREIGETYKILEKVILQKKVPNKREDLLKYLNKRK